MIRMLRFIWDVADRLYKLIPARFLCTHHWKITSVQEESEACRFLVRMECEKCGSTSEHRRP